MLQIVIWLGCFYLVLKGLQLLQAGLAAPEASNIRSIGLFGMFASVIGAIIFVLLANAQVKHSGLGTEFSGSSVLGSSSADVTEQMAADAMAADAVAGAEKAADDVMKGAE